MLAGVHNDVLVANGDGLVERGELDELGPGAHDRKDPHRRWKRSGR
jgi:hypothetical protein